MTEAKEPNGLSALMRFNAQGPFLVGGKCESCQAVFFPNQAICPRCTGQQIIESPPLSRRGKLYSYTTVYQKPPDYSGDVPYVIGRVQLPEGVFILSQIKAAAGDLHVGMEMELVAEPIFSDQNGNEQLGYKFQPADSKPDKV